MKTYLFCIGGTGARVLKALTFYMAADTRFGGEIVPLLIDMDIMNGDADRTIKTLELYRDLSDQAHPRGREGASGFFRNKLSTLASARDTNNKGDVTVRDSFQLDFGSSTQSFSDYIGFNTLEAKDQFLLQALFNNEPASSSQAELNLKLHHGFKGNPNIGSVVFNALVNTNEFRYFENNFNPGDRMFVVSSIFGGTGASGFPQLVKNLRQSNNAAVKNAKIGAVVIMPYFRVDADTNSSINSDAFNSKTKAALHYYSTELDHLLDEVYYLADKPGNSIENNMGGSDQRNNAHVIELLAAQGIQKFVNHPSSERNDATNYYEYGCGDLPRNAELQPLTLKDMYRDVNWEALTQFYLAVKFYHQDIINRGNNDFFRGMKLSGKIHNDLFYQKLKKFFGSTQEWLEEMRDNQRSFVPFDLDGKYNTLVTGKVSKLDPNLFVDPIESQFNKTYKQLSKKEINTEPELFMRLLYEATSTLVSERIPELPSA